MSLRHSLRDTLVNHFVELCMHLSCNLCRIGYTIDHDSTWLDINRCASAKSKSTRFRHTYIQCYRRIQGLQVLCVVLPLGFGSSLQTFNQSLSGWLHVVVCVALFVVNVVEVACWVKVT